MSKNVVQDQRVITYVNTDGARVVYATAYNDEQESKATGDCVERYGTFCEIRTEMT